MVPLQTLSLQTALKKTPSRVSSFVDETRVFYALHDETWGRGYDRIEAAMKEACLQMPTFNYSCQSICASLKREVFVRVNKPKDGEDIHNNDRKDDRKELTERQQEIVSLLKEDCTLTSQKISQKISQKNRATTRTIIQDMKVLQQCGIIHRVGGRKDGYWKIL